MVYTIHFPWAREEQSNVFVAYNSLYKSDGNLSD